MCECANGRLCTRSYKSIKSLAHSHISTFSHFLIIYASLIILTFAHSHILTFAHLTHVFSRFIWRSGLRMFAAYTA